MADIIRNAQVGRLQGQMAAWAYNGLDACVTREVFDVLGPRLGENQRTVYGFEMATQSPAMAMMRRGVAVDHQALSRALAQLDTDLEASHARANALIPPGKWDRLRKVAGKCGDGKNHKWGPKDKPETERACEKCGQRRFVPAEFNSNSDDQVAELLYAKLGLPVQYNHKTKQPSCDEDALDRLHKKFPEHRTLLEEILTSRRTQKQAGVLRSPLSADGRMHSSFNVGAPETGRWSSSKNAYREGTNLQNITEGLRYVFVADPELELLYADLEQAESRCVAYLAEDENYIRAHELGDVHTYVCRMVWPELPWTGDLKEDKKIASQPAPFSRLHHPYRRIIKEVQHGSNYGMTPFGISMRAEISLEAAKQAQGTYFEQFYRIPQWQRAVKREVAETHVLTTPLGRRRQFLGRHWDEHTQREAIAFVPQSMVADILNLSLWRVWRELDTELRTDRAPRPSDPNKVWLLAQIHDAILADVRKGDAETVARVKELMTVPVAMGERIMTIPVDIQRGQNWGKYNDNPAKGPVNLGGMR